MLAPTDDTPAPADEAPAPARAPRGLTTLALWLVLLGALGLRLFRLDGQSLWYDEGVSAYMTHRSLAEIAVATSVDIHPPLYYWLLSLWAVPFGQGEIALRGFSVLLGTVAVWATWRLGRALAGPAVGLAAAALLAISPLAVQYSQEVRMYALASLLAVGSSWAGLALLRALTSEDPLPAARRTRRDALLAVLYGLLAAALLYTHYYGTLVVAAQQLYAGLVLLLTRRWRIVPFWALGSGLAALLFLPWLPVALRQTGYYPGLGTPQPVRALVLDAVNVLSIGVATTRFAFRAGLTPFLLLAALGVAALVDSSGRAGGSPLPGRILSMCPFCPGGVRPQHTLPPLPVGEGRGEGKPAAGSPSPDVGIPRSGGAPPFVWLRERGPGGDAGKPKAGDGGMSAGPGSPVGLTCLVEGRLRGLLPLLWLVLPITGIVVLSRSRPLYEPRFLMLVLPAWTILLGAGLVTLGRVEGGVLTRTTFLPLVARTIAGAALATIVGGLLLVPMTRSLASYYFDPAYARDDYRGLAQTVALREQPGDAVVLTAPGQIEIFGYYFRGHADLFPLPAQRPIDPIDTRGRLEVLAASHDRVWLVRWAANEADPDDLILGWLEVRGRPAGGQRFGQVELRLYDLRSTAEAPAPVETAQPMRSVSCPVGSPSPACGRGGRGVRGVSRRRVKG